jgi:hypothetical protein
VTITPGPGSGDYKKGKARESKTGSVNNKKRDRETPNPMYGKLSSGVAGQEIWCSSVGRLEPTFVPAPLRTAGHTIQILAVTRHLETARFLTKWQFISL